MASQDTLAKSKSAEGNKHELKIKVLTLILNLLKSKYGIEDLDKIGRKIKLEELNTEWQNKSPNRKFKDYKCGRTLKPFIIKECGLKESTQDEFEVVPAAIQAKLQGMSDLPKQESVCDGAGQSSSKKPKDKKQSETGISKSEPKAIASQNSLIESNSAESKKKELKIKVFTLISQLLMSKYGIEESDKIGRKISLEEVNAEWQKKNPNKKFKDYKCGRTLKPFLIKECGLQESTQDEFEVVPAALKAKLQGMSDLPTQETACGGKVKMTSKNLKSTMQPETEVSKSEPIAIASQDSVVDSHSTKDNKHELKIKFLTLILHLLKSKYGIEESDYIGRNINLEVLNAEWQKQNPNKKFKDYKCGRTLKPFLIKECELQESTQDVFEVVPAVIQAKLQGMSDLPTQETACDGKAEMSIKEFKSKKQPKTEVIESEPTVMTAQHSLIKSNSAESKKKELKIKVFTLISQLLMSKYGIEESDKIGRKISLEEVNAEWQKKNPNKKFKDYKCGRTLKPFLIKECGLQESTQDEFEVVPAALKAKLQGMSDLPTQETACDGKAETTSKNLKSTMEPETEVSKSETEAIPSRNSLIKLTSDESKKKELKIKVFSLILHLLMSKYGIEESDKIGRKISLEEVNAEWQKKNPNKEFKDYKYGRTLKPFLIKECGLQESTQDEFEVVPAALKAKLQGMSNLPTEETACHEKEERPTKEWTSKKLPETGVSESERHYMLVVRVLFKCGLPALRDLFRKLHHGWSNKPDDIKKFDIGKVHLKYKDEIRKFESGNIMEWDISLLSKLLLHNAKIKKKLSDEYKTAVELIRDVRNSVQGHSESGKLAKLDYTNKMNNLRNAIVNYLGFIKEEKFDQISEEADSYKDYEFFKFCHKELLSEFSELKQMLHDIQGGSISQKEVYRQAEHRIPNWYEWIELKKKLDMLDTDKNQYILIVDKLSKQGDEYLKILANVNWKLVIDLDPNSDNGGLLTQFKSVCAIVSTLLPSQLKGINPENFPKSNSTQWLHANGRSIQLTDDQKANASEISQYNRDEPKCTIDEWEWHSKASCQELIRIMGKRFDNMKPTFCISLGIQDGLSSEIATLISKEIRGQFDFMDYEMNFIVIDSELDLSKFPNLTCSSLSTFHFLIGLAGLIGNSLQIEYTLPAGMKGCTAPLSSKYFRSLSEYMEILYIGCEDIPKELEDEELESFQKQHLRNFISGNTITLQSLHFRHDARRDLTSEIYVDILSSYNSAQTAKIIKIKHTPGSGGTTLARRVIWDLHERLPCVIIKMDFALQNFGPYSYGETYIENLCKRISKLQSICEVSPVVLMDGNSTQVKTLSSCVARKLRNIPLFILCCVKHKPQAGIRRSNKERSDVLVHREFELGYKLDSRSSEYSDFKKVFQYYRDQFPEDSRTSSKLRQRVYHFPMLALLDDFKKLESIVSDSLDNLKAHKEKEYEIAIIVAFLQQLGDVTTPASLISKYILKSNKSYEKLANQFDDNLMNLMVPGKPPRGKTFIANNYFKGSDDDDDEEETQQRCVIEYYTFQHHQVADAVLKHSRRSLHEITKDFLDYKILECYRRDKEITYVVEQLFLYHEAKNETHFSKLVSKLAKLDKKIVEKNAEENHEEELNAEEENSREEVNEDNIIWDAGKILEGAAMQANDPTFYSHVARFFSYEGNFEKAKELIERGLEIESNEPADRKRRIFDTYGYIVLREMKSKEMEEFEDEHHLQRDAEKALKLFKQARDIPPRNFPNPLLGIVKVWQFCFEYIIQKFENDVEKAIKLTIKDGFFSNAIAKCIDLLNEVDDMVKELQLLPDAIRTKKLADAQRYSIMETFGKARSNTSRQGLGEVNFYRICQSIASYNSTAPEKYLIRLQVMWLISEVKRDFVRLQEEQKKQLYFWLEKLVIKHDMISLARDLLGVAAVQNKPPLQIDRALKIIQDWQNKYPNDYLSYFYQYMLCFIKICEGKISGYKASFELGLSECKKWTEDNMRRDHKQFFISKDRKEICKLLSYSQLLSMNKKRYGERQEKKIDKLDRKFWKSHARDFLLECKGRIQLFGVKVPKPCITLEPGNIRISVHPNDVGILDVDYKQDAKVSFVVAFSLSGPIAESVVIEGQGIEFGT